MAGCILHFGMHKTGSSSIQESLARGLDDPRFHYCSLDDTGSGNSSGPLLLAFLAKPMEHPILRQKAASDADLAARRERVLDRLRTGLAHARERTVILSAEGLCHLDAAELGALVTLIRGFTPEVTAVGYIRAPGSYMQSAFQQRLRVRIGSPPRLDRLYPNYRARFDALLQVLGASNIRFWPFEPSTFHEGCVVRDFCARIGARIDPSLIVRRNEGMSLSAVQLLYAHRIAIPEPAPGRSEFSRWQTLVSALQGVAGPRFELHPQIAAPLLQEHRKDIAWMEAQMGSPLTERAGVPSATAIRDESELLAYRPEAIAWLRAHSRRAARAKDDEFTPPFVAECLQSLEQRMADRQRGKAGVAGMRRLKPRQILRTTVARDPDLGALSPALAERLVEGALRTLGRNLRRNSGRLEVPGLGRFECTRGDGCRFVPEPGQGPDAPDD